MAVFVSTVVCSQVVAENIAIVAANSASARPEVAIDVATTPVITTVRNSMGMKLVLVPAGEFQRGAEEDRTDTLAKFPYCSAAWLEGELPRHAVRISKPFYMGQHEVTLGQFLEFYHAAGHKLEIERDGKPRLGYQSAQLVQSNAFRPWAPGWAIDYDHPAIYVSWHDAVAFCQWLSKTEGKKYRLPTEAEWEYACRAGTNTRYSFGDDPEEMVRHGNGPDQDRKAVTPNAIFASFDVQGKKTGPEIPFPFLARRDGYAWTAPVGKFRPNTFGLYDMHGNAWEWCSDWYDEHAYESASADDPAGPPAGKTRVLRGGGFNYAPVPLRCASRNNDLPSNCGCSYGFRVVCEAQ
ncbi:MAG TPA: formylglycine-generating enzyme family protein [Pirellulales bacterium]|nr:formylglycine-generating enzyme family protein [Pirellulales bacterium]